MYRKASDNKMSLEALSVCFTPNFVRHNDSTTLLKLQRSAQTVFEKLCQLRMDNQLVLTEQESHVAAQKYSQMPYRYHL